jgi:hypothetical protein
MELVDVWITLKRLERTSGRVRDSATRTGQSTTNRRHLECESQRMADSSSEESVVKQVAETLAQRKKVIQNG